jgi:hypothetical protein
LLPGLLTFYLGLRAKERRNRARPGPLSGGGHFW